MKKIPTLLCFAATLAASTLQAQVRQDYWDFDTDAASDSLNAIHNSGVLKSDWDGIAAGGDAADGAGNWIVVGDSSTLQREAPAYGEYAAAPTTGRHRLEIDFAAWAFDAASEGDSLVLRLDESVAAGGDNAARIELRVNGGIAEIRQSTDLVSGGAFRTTALTLTEAAGASAAIEFDFDNDTVVYFVNGEVTHVFNDFDGVDIANILYQKNGAWTTAASSVTVDYMGWVTLEADDTAIEYFTFDSDLAGDQLQEIENSGALGNTWNFNGAGGDAADGFGNWVIPGDSANTNRKLPELEYAVPVTTGRYRFEVDFASWDFDALSVGDQLSLRLAESAAAGGSVIAQFILQVDSASSVRLRLAGDFTSGSAFRNYAFSLAEVSGVRAAIEFDFDNNTAYYIVNGAIQEVFTDFIGTDIGQMLYIKGGDGTDDWATAASSVSLNSFGYRSVDVPASDPNRQEYWDFERDAAGGEFDAITNSGVLNTPWNFSGGKGDAADGQGNWLMVGDSTGITRKVPAADYVSPVTTGTYRLVADLASWNVDAASAGDTWSVKLNESTASGGSTIANILLELTATEVLVKMSTTTIAATGSGKTRTESFPLVNPDGARVEIEFDFDNDVVSYYINGAFKYRFSGADAFNGDDIGQLLYVKSGTWGTAATSLVVEEFGYVAVPANTVIDEWNFEEADGTAPSGALSNNGIGLGGNPPAAVAQISGGELLFGSDGGVTAGLFTASDLSEDPVTSGIVEVSFKVTAACFNNTFANSVLPARAGFRVQDRQDGNNQNIGILKFVYDPVANQFQANSDTLGSGSKTVAIQTGSPVLLEEVTLRMLIDLDEPTVPGSFQAFFTYGDEKEQVVVFDGIVGEAFGGTTQIDVFGINQQITNGETDWKAGDTVTIDDVVIQRVGPVYRPVFLDISYDGTNPTLSFDTVNTLDYSVRASGTVDGEYLEIDTVAGDGTRKDYTDTRPGPFDQQFYIIGEVN